ncbi:MAG: SMC-Scp complex subunit ScpB [Firmicutes bacterium]|nr:SMC-Scp complex subunit ScpB [Bacillota bacterium]
MKEINEVKELKEHDELKRILECLLFVANEPLSEKRLAEISESELLQVRSLLLELMQDYSEHGFQLRKLAGGWQFSTKSAYAMFIEKLYRPKIQQLSRAAMETLAIIAYKQPITRAEVAAIRGVEVDGVISTLLDKSLIQDVGRRLGPGRALLYGTTDGFLAFFGLNSLEELPPATGIDVKNEIAKVEQPELFAVPPALEVLKKNW